jgi:phosphatidylinositol alpha-mannosyltransferase
MKIGLVCPYSIAKGGGVQEHVFAVQAELRRRGQDAYIITPLPAGSNAEDYVGRNIWFVGAAADFRAPWHTTGQISASTDGDGIGELLEREQFDVLHFHEPWVPMLSRQILSRSKTINVATFHAKLPESAMTRTVMQLVTPYTKSVLKYLHELTAVSDPAAEYVRTMTNQPVSIIPNGIDLPKYRGPARRDANKHKTILYVGRLEARKGVKYLIKSFKILSEQQPNTSLVIAGDGPERNKLEALAKDLEINPERITFTGYISDEQKIKYLHSVDLFCSPALFGESFGIVLLEAMAAGLVTVAGNNPGYASVMQGMGAISLINPKDSAEFARRLDMLLHETELRKLWRAWAKEQIPQYSYKHITDQYQAVYELALKQYGNTGGL